MYVCVCVVLCACKTYDGTNARAILHRLCKSKLIHAAIPDPQSFVFGVCSEHEIEVARTALSPAETKIFKVRVGLMLGLGSCMVRVTVRVG